jgi:opacity protein-like surface antigen
VVPGLAHYSVDVGSTFPVTAPDETGFALNAGAGFDFLMADHVSLGLAFNFNQTFTDPALRTLGVLIAMGIYL